MHIRRLFVIVSLCVLSFPLISHRTVNSEWVLLNIDSIASVEFPSQPASETVNGVEVYLVRTQEILFMAMALNHENAPNESYPGSTYNFYLGFMDSMIRDSKSTLTDSASFTVDGYRGIDFSYVGSLANGREAKRRSRAVWIKNKLYCWSYTVLGQETESSRVLSHRFIQSFSVK